MLKPYAMREEDSRGRKYPEPFEEGRRGLYERDIDRVIHSRAFKRLAGKTQVITGRLSDHHRTRLTHSIEVATLCRSVARRLGINEDLSACLGFSHDLGHPPLGHCGEDVLNAICERFGEHFEHNRHSLTIVDEFEQKYSFCPGLNLSFEVREGIVKHSGEPHHALDESLSEFRMDLQPPVESQIVDYCDEACYTYSDLDDSLEAGFVRLEEDVLPSLPSFARLFGTLKASAPGVEEKLVFNETLRRMMSATVMDLVVQTEKKLREGGFASVDEVRRAGCRLAGYSDEMADWVRTLKGFLRERYYTHPEIRANRSANMEKIQKLYELYEEDVSLLPHRYQQMIESGVLPAHRVIIYFIAGFTDHYMQKMIGQHHL